MKKLLYIVPLVAFAFLAIVPGINAQGIDATPAPIVTNVGGLIGILSYALRVVYTIFFILAVIFILMAGFGYLTAGGDPAKVKKASNRLIFGIVGVAVGLLATGVKAIVENTLKSQ
jgi:FtsH-binding integral membrane protein